MKILRILLILIHFFIGFTAGIGAIILALDSTPTGLERLAGSPFTSNVIPALILGVIVSGSNLLALVIQGIKKTWAAEVSVVAGFAMIIWIYVQTYYIIQRSWIQNSYLALGIAILTLIMLRLKYEKPAPIVQPMN